MKNTMKNSFLLAVLLLSMSAFAAKPKFTPQDHALVTFNKVFNDATNVVWSENSKYPVVSFELGSIKTRAFFGKKGALLQTIRYYKGELLPSSIRYKLSKSYHGKEIFGVTEVSDDNGIAYVIILRSDKYLYKVMSDDKGYFQISSRMRRTDS